MYYIMKNYAPLRIQWRGECYRTASRSPLHNGHYVNMEREARCSAQEIILNERRYERRKRSKEN